MTKKNTDIELEKLKAEHVALLETAKRTAADLQNYKRRIEEERSDLKIYANTKNNFLKHSPLSDSNRSKQSEKNSTPNFMKPSCRAPEKKTKSRKSSKKDSPSRVAH
ncbi:MAG: hypothetical protein UW03_C0020G0041 [Candidatus Peregrinibacteria bacterium GW2011_GWA2_43_8]|nr:MAG: hypothetical protein UW03_C0020G0041 [Candidatus Peregrinibacteria bacterium GW2011_GWA2_43_8]